MNILEYEQQKNRIDDFKNILNRIDEIDRVLENIEKFNLIRFQSSTYTIDPEIRNIVTHYDESESIIPIISRFEYSTRF